jgi:hypothetical protein
VSAEGTSDGLADLLRILDGDDGASVSFIVVVCVVSWVVVSRRRCCVGVRRGTTFPLLKNDLVGDKK